MDSKPKTISEWYYLLEPWLDIRELWEFCHWLEETGWSWIYTEPTHGRRLVG